MTDLYDYDIDLNADTIHSRVICPTRYGTKVLELGCASGYISKIPNEQFGCTVTGVELNSEAASEFQTDLSAFPREIVGREEATTYQLVIKARPATEAAALAERRRRIEELQASRDANAERLQQDLETARYPSRTRGRVASHA
jgi:hypothetical protein